MQIIRSLILQQKRNCLIEHLLQYEMIDNPIRSMDIMAIYRRQFISNRWET